ncbi:probable inactive receptor kinase at5g67200 [Phtheirospermum japonicum]|uniref:Probable inactive receptor kinase at5g67200 n=1 Tax=Phtheirospermum japonicum TaxID=374723 RepID=A0A830D4Z3_9LAMI|nr:probable inactive receptor kinase at5g67200 [Phtheirospermum japonicum]
MLKPYLCCSLQNVLVFISFYNHYFLVAFSSSSHGKNPLLPSDASALLEFKSKADLQNKLDFSPKTTFAFCKWEGVQCSDSRAVKVIIESQNLGGVFLPDTLSHLVQLRVLSLRNNSLTGPIPDLSGLVNLKVLFLSRNYFSGSVPPSVSTLHRLKTLDLSNNMLTGSIPPSLNSLDRLYYIRLDFNRFNGSVPPFNHSSLQIFNVSHNDLTGAIPVTPTLSRFNTTSFALNQGLCGEIVHKECRSTRPFFGQPATAAAPPASAALSQTAQSQNGVSFNSKAIMQRHKRAALVLGFTLGASLFVILLVCSIFAVRKYRGSGEITKMPLEASVTGNAEAVMRVEEENDLLVEKVKRVQEEKEKQQLQMVGEAQVYTLDQLMRASAELLGRGTMGTTYKAVLDNRLIVTVKRLDGGRLEGTSQEDFEGHMELVGGLRHPNLVPLRAYFQAKEERLLVYDYQPNGSLFSLIHGSKSSKSKPLHWTSCLKIAEDAAQGLCYIHQAWRLVHGNLKSSNVLLGSDFEACLTDYCLVALASSSSEQDPNSISYRAPEMLKFNNREATTKSDVYSFGVLLLELLTGKHPSEHPNLMPEEMVCWMRSVRDEKCGENRLEMLLEVALACSAASPEPRPTMWQVLKMIQEIKEVVLMEDSEFDPSSGSS